MPDDRAIAPTVLVTGGAGNLGGKVVAHLLSLDDVATVVALDRPGAFHGEAPPKLRRVEADLTDGGDPRWREAVVEADAIVHFAATNTMPDSPWDEAVASFDMAARLIDEAARGKPRRFVFASTNHVMGRYKDPPLAGSIRPGGLTTDIVPAPGTRYRDGVRLITENAYGAAKLMAERALAMRCAAPDARLTGVSLRIGWCQPGENHPRTLNPSGVPDGAAGGEPEDARDLAWFRNMWLSNGDLGRLVERAVLADPAGWPARAITVNGMSANRGMAWDIETTRRLTGYAPQDDVWAILDSPTRPTP